MWEAVWETHVNAGCLGGGVPLRASLGFFSCVDDAAHEHDLAQFVMHDASACASCGGGVAARPLLARQLNLDWSSSSDAAAVDTLAANARQRLAARLRRSNVARLLLLGLQARHPKIQKAERKATGKLRCEVLEQLRRPWRSSTMSSRSSSWSSRRRPATVVRAAVAATTRRRQRTAAAQLQRGSCGEPPDSSGG